MAAASRQAVLERQAVLRAQGPSADAIDVVQAHVAAVQIGDPILMAADYAASARITRGSALVEPQQYFPLAVQRLGSSQLVVRALRRENSADAAPGLTRVVMEWELRGGHANGTRGTDTFTIKGDRIVDQRVVLHTADF